MSSSLWFWYSIMYRFCKLQIINLLSLFKISVDTFRAISFIYWSIFYLYFLLSLYKLLILKLRDPCQSYIIKVFILDYFNHFCSIRYYAIRKINKHLFTSFINEFNWHSEYFDADLEPDRQTDRCSAVFLLSLS
jgi:hypothetical protein